MANRRIGSEILARPANLSLGQIQAAIPKLKRRLEEINAFDPQLAVNNDSQAQILENKIDGTLIEIFGADTIEYNRYRVSTLYVAGVSFGVYSGYTSARKYNGYTKGKQNAIANIKSALEILTEKANDTAVVGGSTPMNLDGTDMHPVLQAAAARLYRDQHYAAAVEAACKALNTQVQAKSGHSDNDNTSLMEFAFSQKNPKLAFNGLQDESDRNEQLGMMFLYKGVFLAFRNPRAHKLVDDDPETAFGALRVIDFLMKALSKTKVP